MLISYLFMFLNYKISKNTGIMIFPYYAYFVGYLLFVYYYLFGLGNPFVSRTSFDTESLSN